MLPDFYDVSHFYNNQLSFYIDHSNKGVYVSGSTSELRVRLACRETGLSPPVKYFTDLSKTVLLL